MGIRMFWVRLRDCSCEEENQNEESTRETAESPTSRCPSRKRPPSRRDRLLLLQLPLLSPVQSSR